jgi:tetratricopeptide (TPR) repeat protein
VQAARLGPSIPNIHGNLRNAHICLGQDQQAADATMRELRLLDDAGSQLDPERIEWLRLQDSDNLAGQHGDFRGRLAIYEQMEGRGDGDTSMEQALALAELREVRASTNILRQWFATRRWDAIRLQAGRAPYWRVRFTQASALGNWPEAALLAARVRDLARSATSAFDRAQLRTVDQPLEAIALARAGDVERAVLQARDLPVDCYLCTRSRAIVAEAQGDRAQADALFAQAVALGPRLPFAYADWGQALLTRGDGAGALEQFDRALVHGPEFADAHNGRGDALAQLGRYEDAVRAYQAAARRAQRWGGLHLRWALALARLRRGAEARAQTCAAAGMDLGAADQNLLAHWMMLARLSC